MSDGDEVTKLRQLAAAMRELGVRKFSMGGVELELADYAVGGEPATPPTPPGGNQQPDDDNWGPQIGKFPD